MTTKVSPKARGILDSAVNDSPDNFAGSAMDEVDQAMIEAKFGHDAAQASMPTDDAFKDTPQTAKPEEVIYDTPETGLFTAPDSVPSDSSDDEPVVADNNGTVDSQGVTFPPELLDQAGITLEEATRQFGTPELLQSAVDYARDQQTRAMIQAGQNLLANQQQQQQPPQSSTQSVEQTVQPQGIDDSGFVPIEIPEDASAELEDMITAMNAVNKQNFERQQLAYRGQLEQITKKFEQQEAAQREQEDRQFIDSLYQGVKNLGPEWEQVFGARHPLELREGTPHYQSWERLIRMGAGLNHARSHYGQQQLGGDELARSVVAAEFNNEKTRIDNEKRGNAVSSRQNQFTSRPNKTDNNAGLSAEQKAINRWDEFLYQQGISNGQSANDPKVL